MAKLHQFDYIFAISVLFAFLDAWNLGANDVGNSFASSVSSGSLKYWQAMVLAGIMEFLGAVLAGSRTSDTIKSKIIDIEVFQDDPAVLMLIMACALVGSSIWQTFSTRLGMPVSTTHAVVGAVIGAGIAAAGADDIHWGWSGFTQIVASWFIAPAVAGVFAAVIFLIAKYGVLERKNNLKYGFILMPILIFATFAILTMMIVWDGAPNLHLDSLPDKTIAGSVCGVGAVAVAIYFVFFYPYFRRRLVHEDWRLKWYHVACGPLYYFKSTDDIPPIPAGMRLIPDYYAGKHHEEYTTTSGDDEENKVSSSQENISTFQQELKVLEEKYPGTTITVNSISETGKLEKKQKTSQLWWSLLKKPAQWPRLAWLILIHGWTQDVISDQVNGTGVLSNNIQDMHSQVKYYDNRIEYLFSLLQAITACTMSFAHGSNDIANAAGPLSTVYQIWTTNEVQKKAEVPIWVLCFTAASLVVGCWTYGYHIMRNLGNRLTLLSPSRGFAIELGAAVTVAMATQLAIPISTTQCAVGATVFCGFAGNPRHFYKTVNWKIVTFCYLGWLITLPCSALMSGLLMAIILNAPRLGATYTLS